MGDTRKRKIDRGDFLSDHVMALKESIHPDIIVKPGDNGQGIYAHKAVLDQNISISENILPLQFLMGELSPHVEDFDTDAPSCLEGFDRLKIDAVQNKIKRVDILSEKKAVRSKVFRNMLESDECKVSPEESITIPDLSYEELKSLLEFFYNGTLSPNNKHIRALYLAADKYDIQYLQDVCREQIISNLSIDNVLDILELSTIPSDNILKQAALLAFASRYSHVIFSQRFESFALKNPHLNLEITRACWHRFSACLRKYLQEQPR